MSKETINLIPKFKLFDKIYYLAPQATEILQVIITAISICAKNGVTYQVNDSYITVHEERLAKNKDSLMKELNENIAGKAKHDAFFRKERIKKLEADIEEQEDDIKANKIELEVLQKKLINKNDKDL